MRIKVKKRINSAEDKKKFFFFFLNAFDFYGKKRNFQQSVIHASWATTFFWHRNTRVKNPVAKTQISILVRDKLIWNSRNSHLKLVLQSLLLHTHRDRETERERERSNFGFSLEEIKQYQVPFYSFFLCVCVLLTRFVVFP